MKERLIAAAIVGAFVLMGAMIAADGGHAGTGQPVPWVTVEPDPAPPPAKNNQAETPAAEIAEADPALMKSTEAPASYQPNLPAANAARLNAIEARLTKLETDVATIAPRSPSDTPKPAPAAPVEIISYGPPIVSESVVYSVPTYAGPVYSSNCANGVCRPAAAAPMRRGLFRRW